MISHYVLFLQGVCKRMTSAVHCSYNTASILNEQIKAMFFFFAVRTA